MIVYERTETLFCADTNCWIAFLAGDDADDVRYLRVAIEGQAIVMAPIVLAELLSWPDFPRNAENGLASLPSRPLSAEYWVNSGRLRAKMFRKGMRPRLMDTLIAQFCIEHELILLTRDKGFEAFAKHAGLSLWRP